MTGKLQKIDDNWFVAYKIDSDLIATDGGLIPLHPDDIEQIRLDSMVFDNIEARIGSYPYVEFHFHEIWEEVDGETGVTKYAKLGPAPKNKYPELEGTNALCEDIIEKRKEERNKIVKLSEEEWVECDGCNDNDKYFWIKGFIAGKSHNELPEISDEEIQKAAESQATFAPSFVRGVEWYREQLKSRQ